MLFRSALAIRLGGPVCVLAMLATSSLGVEPAWEELTAGPKALEKWQGAGKEWTVAGDAELDPKNPRKLLPRPGEGVIVPRDGGRAPNLVSKGRYGDVELEVEFLVPRGSNSGVKLIGHYEIQIFDSYGRKTATATDCGGIYPRAELQPTYHYLDKGTPPRVNAARPAGEWQTLRIVFQAPRFDAAGKKTANAKFVHVVLNGQTIHENVELECPTGANWRLSKEVPTGPILLQGDHGPVAFRNIRVRPWGGNGHR